jgi:hypothetical protein
MEETDRHCITLASPAAARNRQRDEAVDNPARSPSTSQIAGIALPLVASGRRWWRKEYACRAYRVPADCQWQIACVGARWRDSGVAAGVPAICKWACKEICKWACKEM